MNLNAEKLMDTYVKRGIRWLNKATSVYVEWLKANTPEDTGEMVNSYWTEEAERKGNIIESAAFNDSKHAIFVEYGVWGKAYNYHKPKGVVFFTGVWNKTFQRTLLAMKDNIFSIINDALWWA